MTPDAAGFATNLSSHRRERRVDLRSERESVRADWIGKRTARIREIHYDLF